MGLPVQLMSIYKDKAGCNLRTPIVSAEIFIIPLESGRWIVYAPLRPAAFVANATVINFLVDLKSGSYDNTVDPDGSLVEFLHCLGIVDSGPEKPPLHTLRGDLQPTAVTLFLTNACNLRCTYCYAAAGKEPRKFMSLEVAKRGIDFVAGNTAKKKLPFFEVSYHGGGEPTLNWPTLTRSLEYARKKAEQLGLSVLAGVATNGVLSKTQIDWIVANFHSVTVSFDGLPAVHDRNRVRANGQGSSKRVMHTLSRFDEAGFSYALRLTVTPVDIPSLPESVEFIFQHFNPKEVQVEPVYQLGRWANSPSAETSAFIEAYRAAQERARRHGREIRYSAARLEIVTNHFCAVSQDNFCLSPDGNVSACYEACSEESHGATVFFYGKLDREKGILYDTRTLDNLRRQSVEHKPYCQGCFAKFHCAGDCAYKSFLTSGRSEFAGSSRCQITQELTKDQIVARIIRAGGLFWRESLVNEIGQSPDAEVPS